MNRSQGTYQGDLHCEIAHPASGKKVETDSPKSRQGRGMAFSPTDLTSASLGASMVTTMALAAKTLLGFDIRGVRWEVVKEMSVDTPRRIIRITTQIWLPLLRSKDPQGILERAALGCPVYHSLNPTIDRPVTFHWQELPKSLAR
ncbi:MAG TPA: OsmC family protein [Candidatus Didemnitutus sp.]|jgi:uncharacterized OsmC-like protein